MKLVKALLLAAFLCLAPTMGLAGGLLGDDEFDGYIGDDAADDFVAPVPEPAGALVMAAGLLTVGLVWRRRRR